MTFRWIFRVDTIQRFLRVARVVWDRGTVGDGTGYSAKLSFALDPQMFRWFERDATTDCRFTFLGVRVHYCRSYGGRFAA